MITRRISATAIFCLALGLIACETEDPGPVQKFEKEFYDVDFERIEVASALDVHVEQSNIYSITVSGDRRNIDDLQIYKSGNTLVLKFDDNPNRIHDTKIEITMPRLEGANFSAACSSTINGFESDEDLDLFVAGASVCQVNAGYREVNLSLSGASNR